jgi:hypothetical protein
VREDAEHCCKKDDDTSWWSFSWNHFYSFFRKVGRTRFQDKSAPYGITIRRPAWAMEIAA